MEDWQKKVFDDNLERLSNSIKPNPMIYNKLLTAKLLTYDEVDELERIEDHDRFGRLRVHTRFFGFLRERENSYDKLTQVMDDLHQTGFSRILKDGKRDEMMRQLEDGDAIKAALNFFSKTDRLKVVVKKPDSGCVDRKDDDYKLKKNGIRRALLLNIIEFDNPELLREGADADTEYMKELLKGLNFEILPKNPGKKTKYTKEELLKEIDNFSEDCNEDEVDACMVFVASHGYRDKIVTSDEKHVDIYEDIVNKFSHDRATGCPQMEGRPKIFIFPTCQDFYKPATAQSSSVTDKVEGSTENGRPPSPDEQPRTSVKRPRTPSPGVGVLSKKISTDGGDDSSRDIKDAIVILPQVPGCSANRDKFRGTWFVFIFVYVLMNLAYDTPLTKMMEKVQKLVYKVKGIRREDKQLATFTNIGFETMYLFPKKE